MTQDSTAVQTASTRDPMATTEIEKLERRYAENPQGLTFAPLAEVHRKNGDVARALELLRAGLELHPNYIPASIVLGRCHWDLGDLPAAEAAFAHVLRLDDENVIALKSLADINERLERFGEAQRWLSRLISVDRSNEEARQQLARMETAKAQSERKGSGAEPTAPADLPHEIAAADSKPVPAVQVEPAPLVAASVASEPVPVDLTPPLSEPEASSGTRGEESKSPTLEFLDTSEPPRPSEQVSAGEPSAVAGLISQEFVPPKDTSFPLHPELSQGMAPLDDSFERLEVETAEEVELQSSGASEFRVPNAAEDFLDIAAAAPRAADVEPVALPERRGPEEVARPSPRMAEPVEKPPEQPKRSYAARDTKGQSVASFFAALLAARPPGSSSAPPVAEVSGDGSAPRHPEEAPVPVANASVDAAVSFDEFFGAAPASSPVPQTNPDPGKDDLDQFQSWLQNLKR